MARPLTLVPGARPTLGLALALAIALGGCTLPDAPPAALERASLDARPVHFAAGADAAPDHLSRAVPRYVLTPEGGLDVEIAGSPGTRLTIDSLARLVNDDADAHSVVVRAARIASPDVVSFRLEGPGGAVLDLLAEAPMASLTLEPGARADLGVELSLVEGARGPLPVVALTVDVMTV